MPNGLLIGLAGPARVGKSSAAEILARDHGLISLSFADPIRAMLRSVFDWNSIHFHGLEKDVVDPRYNISPREAVKSLGHWGRRHDPMFWIRVSESRMEERRRKHLMFGARWPGVVFSDVCLRNEAAWIRGRGGTIIHLSRMPAILVPDPNTADDIPFRPGDLQIANDGTIKGLRKRMADIVFNLTARNVS